MVALPVLELPDKGARVRGPAAGQIPQAEEPRDASGRPAIGETFSGAENRRRVVEPQGQAMLFLDAILPFEPRLPGVPHARYGQTGIARLAITGDDAANGVRRAELLRRDNAVGQGGLKPGEDFIQACVRDSGSTSDL